MFSSLKEASTEVNSLVKHGWTSGIFKAQTFTLNGFILILLFLFKLRNTFMHWLTCLKQTMFLICTLCYGNKTQICCIKSEMISVILLVVYKCKRSTIQPSMYLQVKIMWILKSRIKMAQRTQSVYPQGTTVIPRTLFQEWCEYWHLILNLSVRDTYMEKQQQQNTNIPPLSWPRRDIGFCNRKVSFQCHFLIHSNLMTMILHAHRHTPQVKK